MAQIPTTSTPDSVITSALDPNSPRYQKNTRAMADLVTTIAREQEKIREGGGMKAIQSQHAKGRLTARERVALLIDPGTELLELGIYAAHGMYEEWGGAPGAGVVAGLARVQGRLFMVIVNDATYASPGTSPGLQNGRAQMDVAANAASAAKIQLRVFPNRASAVSSCFGKRGHR